MFCSAEEVDPNFISVTKPPLMKLQISKPSFWRKDLRESGPKIGPTGVTLVWIQLTNPCMILMLDFFLSFFLDAWVKNSPTKRKPSRSPRKLHLQGLPSAFRIPQQGSWYVIPRQGMSKLKCPAWVSVRAQQNGHGTGHRAGATDPSLNAALCTCTRVSCAPILARS